ncbi:23S rRNA (guanosine2251-2'-O)-methyltransferase [Polynucleobacter sphagniphilus]|jgi:23S rRNA (guanosine2251-2'-O)-methyltransferase|uniref:23S rRNA (guanosine-2'-O-)-methyltransferase RlmB n=1 Tax=Polynucleobacter sphagniphilus TaxID=1743169 RepID=A0AA43S664_9BURK|nr:23S rRNA (guanosine(2251)-2'-O)-methyltransferase RlmB [Polynucleobacter sphagniphilus]MDH6241068.1 23S rRNA (guanosine2251-2'-O)-methyltransferase [Polynucleobacter sphagniphilus]MDH6301728.1 23S rRNA (guanosine2251-2'-O)-methyltransferase [Polynucleobacter sphagniphilus]MDH6503516.1 23S rRNA (guanosine2251-2'-O)-methyltransferase [Polynucleobacter sphagniphilus]MDH6513084.1 23S rRNA (guanosine2251-2'-O)-methyltransferase [Polynucleobacter sphagniphilus]MDH6523798.1 23S rRNA (guanosine2251
MKQILVGFHAVQARLRVDPESLKSVYFDPSRRDRRMGDFLKQAEETLGERLHAADAERLHKLAGHDRHQGVVALAEKMTIARTITEVIEDVEGAKEKPLFLILDGVTDPHNFGACLRVADGAGVNAVVIPKDRSASINATVSKVSSGASEVMPVITVTNLVRSMKEMQESGVWIIGTDDGAEKSIYDIDLTGSIAIVMGAEGEGMRRLTKETCDELVHIPMQGVVSSLNVSVASGVCLYEALRQRLAKPAK